MIKQCAKHSIHYATENGCPGCRLPKELHIDIEENFKRAWSVDYWTPNSSVYKHYHNPKFIEQRKKFSDEFMTSCINETLSDPKFKDDIPIFWEQ